MGISKEFKELCLEIKYDFNKTSKEIMFVVSDMKYDLLQNIECKLIRVRHCVIRSLSKIFMKTYWHEKLSNMSVVEEIDKFLLTPFIPFVLLIKFILKRFNHFETKKINKRCEQLNHKFDSLNIRLKERLKDGGRLDLFIKLIGDYKRFEQELNNERNIIQKYDLVFEPELYDVLLNIRKLKYNRSRRRNTRIKFYEKVLQSVENKIIQNEKYHNNVYSKLLFIESLSFKINKNKETV